MPFLGWVVTPERRRLKRRKVVQARRHLRRLAVERLRGEVSAERLEAGVRGWLEHARHGDTEALRRELGRQIAAATGWPGRTRRPPH